MKDYTVRLARVEDARELVSLYAPYVLHTAVSFEYDVPSVGEFEKRITETLKQYPYFVAEENGSIVGYAYAGPFHARRAYAYAAELSVYVRTDKRKTGIGRRLYQALELALSLQNILRLYACIAYPPVADAYLTAASVDFHERMGFQLCGRFHQCGYKFGRWYDTVWMEKSIGTPAAVLPAVCGFREIQEEFFRRLSQEVEN